jgi:hypothetical protein
VSLFVLAGSPGALWISNRVWFDMTTVMAAASAGPVIVNSLNNNGGI